MTKTVTYHSTNADPSEAWIAYPVLPNGQMWQVRFTGKTEAEAQSKAIALMDKELAKAPKTTSVSIADIQKDGRGQANTGKTWMWHSVKGYARVEQDKVDSHLAAGYIKKGPRSK